MLHSKKKIAPQPSQSPKPKYRGRRGDMFQPIISDESSFKGRRGDMPMLNKNRTYRYPIVHDPNHKSIKQMNFDDDVHFEDLLFDGAKNYKDYSRIRNKYYEGRL